MGDAYAVMAILALVFAVIGTVLAFVLITPAKKRASLPKALQIVHDIFNFKGLIIEVILKALYIFATLYTILEGFLTFFTFENVGGSLLTMILGPVAVRIVFELIMITILQVKNIIQINNKIKSDDEKSSNDGFSMDFTQYK